MDQFWLSLNSNIAADAAAAEYQRLVDWLVANRSDLVKPGVKAVDAIMAELAPKQR